MSDTQIRLTAVAAMVLDKFDNMTLAAFNIAVQTNGIIDKNNLSYDAALKAKLINEDGLPYDLKIIRDASAHIIDKRVDNNLW